MSISNLKPQMMSHVLGIPEPKLIMGEWKKKVKTMNKGQKKVGEKKEINPFQKLSMQKVEAKQNEFSLCYITLTSHKLHKEEST